METEASTVKMNEFTPAKRHLRIVLLPRRVIQRVSNFSHGLWINHGSRLLGKRFYGNWFFEACLDDNMKSHPVIARVLTARLGPERVVDFGCGDGSLLAQFAEAGVEGTGYEFSDAGLRRCRDRGITAYQLDFRDHTLPSPMAYGALVICLEVAEHLPPRDADFLCEVLRACGGSKWLVFSAAIPGQGGEGHLNEQPPEYWRAKLHGHGWRYDAPLTQQQQAIWRDGGVMFYYWQNLQIFVRNQQS